MPEGPDIAIEVRHLGVCYRRYLKKITTLKEAFVSMFQGSHFESFWALRDFNLTVARGERVGVIGPNGSGKSTLLKVIAGVLPPTEGQVVTSGRIAPLLELGSGFKNDLTGRENIFLNGAILGLPPAQMKERFERIVTFSGIGDFINAPLSTYSSGMRTRLGFAVATDVDADILLLDEILSVGDAAFQEKALRRIEDLLSQGVTVILVSHDIGQIRRICSRAVYIEKGRIKMSGDVTTVTEGYLRSVSRKTSLEAAR